VIAQDGAGRILIVVTTPVEVTLSEMTGWLLTSGLNVVTALNLDGGFSSQMIIPASGDQPELASGIVGVPVVLVVYSR
jgi:exopolysaccharide biosynthesis protein